MKILDLPLCNLTKINNLLLMQMKRKNNSRR